MSTTITTPANETRKAVKKQFAILKHKRQMLTILVLLFICVIGWVVVSLFAAQQKTKIDSKLLKYAQPLTANLDLATLNSLEEKRSFTEAELSNFPIFRVFTDQLHEQQSGPQPPQLLKRHKDRLIWIKLTMSHLRVFVSLIFRIASNLFFI
jgi:hypothetical protein